MNRPGLIRRLYPHQPDTNMPIEPIRKAEAVVSPVVETANPTPTPGIGGTVYHDMTPQSRWIIILTRVLYVLGFASTNAAAIIGYLPANWLPYVNLTVGLIPGVEWLVRKFCDWLDNGAFDESYTGR
ncbi:MAG: hypothetical protein ACAI35_04395 [Candidatus Methylacidiphilales bacterium]